MTRVRSVYDHLIPTATQPAALVTGKSMGKAYAAEKLVGLGDIEYDTCADVVRAIEACRPSPPPPARLPSRPAVQAMTTMELVRLIDQHADIDDAETKGAMVENIEATRRSRAKSRFEIMSDEELEKCCEHAGLPLDDRGTMIEKLLAKPAFE